MFCRVLTTMIRLWNTINISYFVFIIELETHGTRYANWWLLHSFLFASVCLYVVCMFVILSLVSVFDYVILLIRLSSSLLPCRREKNKKQKVTQEAWLEGWLRAIIRKKNGNDKTRGWQVVCQLESRKNQWMNHHKMTRCFPSDHLSRSLSLSLSAVIRLCQCHRNSSFPFW